MFFFSHNLYDVSLGVFSNLMFENNIFKCGNVTWWWELFFFWNLACSVINISSLFFFVNLSCWVENIFRFLFFFIYKLCFFKGIKKPCEVLKSVRQTSLIRESALFRMFLIENSTFQDFYCKAKLEFMYFVPSGIKSFLREKLIFVVVVQFRSRKKLKHERKVIGCGKRHFKIVFMIKGRFMTE